MRIVKEAIDYDDVLLVPSRNTLESRKDVNLSRTFEFYHSPRVWSGLPIMCANVATTGTLTMSKQLRKWGMITALHKYYTPEQLNSVFPYGWNDTTGIIDYTWVTIGMKDEDIQRIRNLDNLNNSDLPNIVIDVPNGHIEKFVKFCSKVRNEFPESIICAGNVASPSITQEIIIHGGVDIVKVGIGCSRQLCSTRLVAGVGYPQLSCISECANVAHGLKSGEKRLGLICGDGGINHVGDFAKGFGTGADFLMSASMFAGTDECDEAEWELEYEYCNWDGSYTWKSPLSSLFSHCNKTGKSRKNRMKYYGMSSHYAQKKHGEGEKSYRASEGEISWIDYKGPVDDIIREIRGGLASAGTYIGAGSLKDFAKCANFVKVNRIK